jgi:gas vesicle protein
MTCPLMFSIPPVAIPLDPGLAALIGAFIGAGSSVIVQIIAAFVTARHETRSFRRNLRKETIASITDAYEYALNVIFNMQSGGGPDRTTQGNVFAQISLRGSSQVKTLVSKFKELPPAERASFKTEELIKAMQEHIAQLESE